ncbi:MAG TPA: hypothetical protein VHC90_05470 [Bryobacteraceae bacterium]|nr:hypothetical protein [Bryobacteraceae bacterium]
MPAKSKLIALNAALAAGLALVVWQGAEAWKDAQAQRKATINVPVKTITPPPMTPAKKPDAVQAANYADVASKNLFSKDRNPTVVVDPPKVEPPKVMPALPVVYGVLGLPSGVKAIMAERPGAQSKPVQAGETIGEFKILALDLRKIKFEWEGREIDRNLDELADRSATPAATAAGNALANQGPAVPPPPAPQSSQPTSASLGADSGTPEAPSRNCVAGDSSAIGSVVDGYKKTGVATPFGTMGCKWVKQ